MRFNALLSRSCEVFFQNMPELTWPANNAAQAPSVHLWRSASSYNILDTHSRRPDGWTHKTARTVLQWHTGWIITLTL